MLPVPIFSMKFIVKRDIKVAWVLLIGRHVDLPKDRLALVHDQSVVQIKHCLLPMCVAEFGTSREMDRFMGLSKRDVEVTNDGVDVVIPYSGEAEGGGECQVCQGDCHHVDVLYWTGLGHHSLLIYEVDQGLHHGHLFHTAHVEPPHVVPEVDFLSLVVTVFDCNQVQGSFVGKDFAIGSHPLVPGEDHSVQHRLVQQKIAHPLRYNNIHLWYRKLHLLHFAFYKRNGM
mmetsp:Transcript_4058/g.6262  ORF Transcript_4058/g.6262 Transcript_4058/m.6262 type:complete len:229 (-) Transcript_4058:512-1198(-)